jgi:phage gpG-like protein
MEVVVDYRHFSKLLQECANAASPQMIRKYFKNAGAVILQMEHGIFKSQGADLGAAWKPLSPVTLAMRKKWRNLKGKRASGMLALQDTGQLRMSITGGSYERGPTGAIRDVLPVELRIGTRLPYASTHQYGRGRMRVQVPEHRRKGYNVRAHRVSARSVLAHSYTTKRGTVVHVGAYTIRSHSVRAHGVIPGSVSAHSKSVPPIPARPFAGWTPTGIDRVTQEAVRHFIDEPDRKTR